MLNKKGVCALAVASAGMFLLSGCDSMRSTFGLDHYQPDEFNVDNHQPLSMPPNYDLAPPEVSAAVTSAKRSKDESAAQKAQNVLIGRAVDKSATESVGAKAIVEKVSEKQIADANIRDTVTKEAKDNPEANNALADTFSKIGAEIKKNAKRTSNDDADTKEEVSPGQLAAPAA